jgi:phosphatidylserine decarboxylase
VLRAVTLAPGTAAPVESATVPPKSAVVYCAGIVAHNNAQRIKNLVVVKSLLRSIVFSISPVEG